MQSCEKFRDRILDILKQSDLSTISTKSVRRDLEKKVGYSLSDIKKEINHYIEDLFMDYQQKEEKKAKKAAATVMKEVKEESPVKKESTIKMESGNKVTKARAVKKPVTAKKTKAPKERKQADWPLCKIHAPLCDIIGTSLCSRPQTVSKLWEYVRENKLQLESDKRQIICDEKFKELTGEDQITGFSMNKFIQKYFEPIPKEEQPKYKAILREQEAGYEKV